MRQGATWAGRTILLWIAMALGTILAGMAIPSVPHPGAPDGPLNVLTAVAVVNALGALVVAGLASNLTVGGWRKAMILAAAVFALETGLSWIEATAFNAFLRLSSAELGAMLATGAIRAVVAGVAAALLWPRPAPGAPEAPRWAWLVPVAGLYALLYFAAGFFVAWSSEAVRTYYAGGVGIDVAGLLGLQLGRGLLWAGLAAGLAATLRGRALTAGLWTGAAFAVLMTAPLLSPSAIMPWPVRQTHLIEVMLSNAVFGVLAVLVLRRRARDA